MRRSTLPVGSDIVVLCLVTVSFRSTRILFMLVRLISWVLIFLPAFLIVRAWIALSAMVTRLVMVDCVVVLNLCISFSALFTTMPTSVIEAVIQSSVFCSNFDSVVCNVVCILRILFSTNFTVACSLLMVAFILFWKSSAVMLVVVTCLAMNASSASSQWMRLRRCLGPRP